jgi:hypothetical protein
MKKPFYIPEDYDRIKVVDSLAAIAEPFEGPVNCNLFPRRLTENFNALAATFLPVQEKRPYFPGFEGARDFEEYLRSTQGEARVAGERILQDMQDISALFGDAFLRVVNPVFPYMFPDPCFHGDTVKKRVLCCYVNPVTRWVRNDQATRKLVPHGDGDGFEAEDWVELYTPEPGADIRSFAPTDIWCHSGWVHKEDRPSFAHAVPEKDQVVLPRLLLVAQKRAPGK